MKGLAVLDRDHAVAVAGQYAVQLDNGFWSLTRMPG
jgi:hypothetical protein